MNMYISIPTTGELLLFCFFKHVDVHIDVMMFLQSFVQIGSSLKEETW